MEKKEPISKITNIINQLALKKSKEEKKRDLEKKLRAHSKEIKWLTDEVESVGYYCNYDEELKKQIERINKYSHQIKAYFGKHPREEKKMTKAVEELYGFARYIRAMTDGADVELSVMNDENEFHKLNDVQKEILSQANAYREACSFMEEQAKDENSFLNDNLFIKAHYIMESGSVDDIKNVRKLRFRNETDKLIIELRGFFNPLDGDKVASRMTELFCDVDFVWKDLNPIEKAVRFAAEYIRIQPHMDGNKRIALLGMNYILMKSGYMPIYFEYSEFSPMCKQYEKIDGFNFVNQQGFAADIKEAILYRDLTSMMKTVCNKLESRTVKYVKRIGNNELAEQMNKLRKKENENI